MKRAALLALMMTLVLLTACGSGQQRRDAFEQWREAFLAEPKHSITAEVTAIAEESETVFLLHCDCKEDKISVEVLEPKNISGVKAYLSEGEGTLVYEGAVLSLGAGMPEGVSPISALPMFMDFLKNGHTEDVWTETLNGEEALVTELENALGGKMTLWQSSSSMQPLFAAVRSGDVTELKIQIQKIE